jgi:hypothetical protein
MEDTQILLTLDKLKSSEKYKLCVNNKSPKLDGL